jgi:hypothetical protein
MIACPRPRADCPTDFAAAGILAGHLCQDHHVSASLALSEARRAFGIPTIAAPSPIAPTSIPSPPKEASMAKKKRQVTCRACGTMGHIAKTCPRSAAATAKTTARKPLGGGQRIGRHPRRDRDEAGRDRRSGIGPRGPRAAVMPSWEVGR